MVYIFTLLQFKICVFDTINFNNFDFDKIVIFMFICSMLSCIIYGLCLVLYPYTVYEVIEDFNGD